MFFLHMNTPELADQQRHKDGICLPTHQRDECATKPFLRWVQAQGRSPHAPGISKNASDPVGIPLKGAPQAPSDKPHPLRRGLKPGVTAP